MSEQWKIFMNKGCHQISFYKKWEKTIRMMFKYIFFNIKIFTLLLLNNKMLYPPTIDNQTEERYNYRVLVKGGDESYENSKYW